MQLVLALLLAEFTPARRSRALGRLSSMRVLFDDTGGIRQSLRSDGRPVRDPCFFMCAKYRPPVPV
jgi:hypothetical protein